MSIGELLKYAESNNIEVDKRWGKKKLINFISNESPAAVVDDVKVLAFRNISKGKVVIFGNRIGVGCIHEVTELNSQDKRGMAKLKRLAEFGMIEEV